jgi:hypothetical protein
MAKSGEGGGNRGALNDSMFIDAQVDSSLHAYSSDTAELLQKIFKCMSQYFITVFLVSDIIFVHVAWYKV